MGTPNPLKKWSGVKYYHIALNPSQIILKPAQNLPKSALKPGEAWARTSITGGGLFIQGGGYAFNMCSICLNMYYLVLNVEIACYAHIEIVVTLTVVKLFIVLGIPKDE